MSLPRGPADKPSSPLGMWTTRRLLWAGGVALVAWLILILVLVTVRPEEPSDSTGTAGETRRTTTTTGPPSVAVPPTCPAPDSKALDAIGATLDEGVVMAEATQWVGADDGAFVAGNVYDASDRKQAAAALWLIKDGKAFTLNEEARRVSNAPSGVDQLSQPLASYGAVLAAKQCALAANHVPR